MPRAFTSLATQPTRENCEMSRPRGLGETAHLQRLPTRACAPVSPMSEIIVSTSPLGHCKDRRDSHHEPPSKERTSHSAREATYEMPTKRLIMQRIHNFIFLKQSSVIKISSSSSKGEGPFCGKQVNCFHSGGDRPHFLFVVDILIEPPCFSQDAFVCRLWLVGRAGFRKRKPASERLRR